MKFKIINRWDRKTYEIEGATLEEALKKINLPKKNIILLEDKPKEVEKKQ